MGNFSYITNRTVQNKAGELKGKIAVLVRKGSSIAEYKYICPECGDAADGQQEFKRPITIRCQKCGFLMKLPKLKDELKKDKKKIRDAA